MSEMLESANMIQTATC